MHARRTAPPLDHARRIRPETPTHPRRLIAAALSAVLPGLGQLLNGRGPLGRRLLAPIAVVVAIVLIALQLSSPIRLAASLVSPTAMTILLGANVALLIWRLFATLHAFFDKRYPAQTGRGGLIVLAGLCLAVAIPHGVAHVYGSAARDAFAVVFEEAPSEGTDPGPAAGERINVLIVGIDKIPGRTATLTNSMMVASVDPVGNSVSMLSIPRDLGRVPLPNGDVFGPKINSLMSFADRNPKDFPAGGMRTLQDALGTMLGIRIHYYAQMDFIGFAEMIDAVGGIDIDVDHGFSDPTYDGYGLAGRGWSVEAGPNHFGGYDALAYARVRKPAGESDYTRAGRQQEILIALRNKLTEAGSLLFGLPGLLDAMASYVRTDVPSDRLPELAAITDEMARDAIARAVLRPPLIRAGVKDPQFGTIQVPQLAQIRAMVADLFSAPGTPPTPWPTPTPGPSPKPVASP